METLSPNQRIQYDITVTMKQQALMKNVRALLLYQRLMTAGQIVHMNPTYDVIERDIHFNGELMMCVQTHLNSQQLEQLIYMPDLHTIEIQHTVEATTVNVTNQKYEELYSQRIEPTKPSMTSVHLMQLIEELVIDQMRLVTVSDAMSERTSIYEQAHVEQLHEITNHLERVITELKTTITNTYKRPIASIFEAFQPYCHHFTLIGGELTVEDTLLQYIQSPMHMLLTSIFECGATNVQLTITSLHHVLCLQFDVQLDRCVDRLTDVLDTVKQAIYERGTLQVETTERNMVVQISFSSTSSIMPALLIEFGHDVFAVPLTYVTELMRIESTHIQRVGDREVSIVRDQLLPLVRMGKQLQPTYNPALKKREIVVIVTMEGRHVGMIVEKMHSKQNIVLKPLSSYIGTPPYIAGATIIGSGDVAMILDVAQVVEKHGALWEQRCINSS